MPGMASRTGSVHAATTRRVYEGKVYETHPLRRSYREDGKVQMGLFDAKNLAEVSSPSFPGERLITVAPGLEDPDLATLRAKTREAVLVRSEARLQVIERAVRAGRLKHAGKIGERVGRAWRNDKMRKHFVVEVGPSSFAWRRDADSIQAESALDGLYVVRTSLPADAEPPPSASCATTSASPRSSVSFAR